MIGIFERVTSASKLKRSLNYLAPRTMSFFFCHFSDMSVIKTDKANSIEMFNPCSASMMKMTKEVCTVSVLQYFIVLRRVWIFPPKPIHLAFEASEFVSRNKILKHRHPSWLEQTSCLWRPLKTNQFSGWVVI